MKYIQSAKKYSDYIIMKKDARLKGYSLIHGLLALIVANHESTYHPSVGHAIGDAMDSLFLNQNMSYDRLKENPDMIAQFVINHVTKEIPVADEEKLKQAIKRGLPLIFKIVDKMWPEPNHPNLKVIGKALHEVDDPVGILKRNGIDIEPELEEFRGFLAEISGKKIEAKKPKFPETKKAVENVGSASLSHVKLEVLSIINGLEFAGYTEEAKRKAVEKLSSRIAGLSDENPTPENLQSLGLYALSIELIKRGRMERLRELLSSL